MLLYAEGTRFTKEKHEASIDFARKKGLPELKEHLLPRTKGFSLGLPHFRHNLPAVYNVQIAFKGYVYVYVYLFTISKYNFSIIVVSTKLEFRKKTN